MGVDKVSHELHSLYCSPNVVMVIKSRKLGWTGHAATMEESRDAFKNLTDKPTIKGTLERSRRRWKDNTRIDL